MFEKPITEYKNVSIEKCEMNPVENLKRNVNADINSNQQPMTDSHAFFALTSIVSIARISFNCPCAI